MAKLLACALNAEGGPRTDFDPASDACRAIIAGTSLDVVEMDAASNNSVDDIRELRENVALAPMRAAAACTSSTRRTCSRTAAWNAFLKTLEEPPPHVVFVLATTEAHKVPATIVDRCHRFDFQPAVARAGRRRGQTVAAEEEIELPDPAVGMIARAATGSFRDALGTLEQMVTYGGRELELDDVLEMLGVADAALVLDTTEALAEHDPRAALLAVQRLADSGRDFKQFMRDLTAHLRHLYEVQTLGEVPDSFSVTAEHTERLAAQAERLNAGRAAAGDRPPGRRARRGEGRLGAADPARDGAAQGHPAPGRPVAAGADVPHRAARGAARRGDAAAGSPAAPAEEARASAAPARRAQPPGLRRRRRRWRRLPATAVAAEPEPEHAPRSRRARPGALAGLWPAVAEAVPEENGMLGAALGAARPVALEGDRLTVAFPPDAAFVKKKAEATASCCASAARAHRRGAQRGLRAARRRRRPPARRCWARRS